MQRKMGRTSHSTTRQHGLKLASRFQSLQFDAAPELLVSYALVEQPD
jgi:hypothetical protein